MEIAALVLGIIGFILALIPGCGIILGGIPALVGLILAIIALVKKKPKKKSAIAGLVLSILAFIAMIAIPLIFGLGTYIYNSASSSITQNPISDSREYSMGQTYNGEDLRVKFVSCDKNFTEYNPGATVREGYKIVKAEFEFENKGQSTEYVSSYKFDCYADDVACNKFYSVSDASFSKSLDEGEKDRAAVYFEVPENADEVIIKYSKDYSSTGKINFKVQ